MIIRKVEAAMSPRMRAFFTSGGTFQLDFEDEVFEP